MNTGSRVPIVERENSCRRMADYVSEAGNVAVVRSRKRRRTMEGHTFGRPLHVLLTQPCRFGPSKQISLGKFGMKKFAVNKTELQQYKLHPYIDRHMSPHDALFPIAGCGQEKMVLDWFTALTPSVKEKVRKAGFEELILCLQPAVIDGPLIQALATKWWDTTHTFHFTHIGELTLTPTDFSAITGLDVSGIPLFLKHRIYRDKKVLHRLLGDAVCMWNSKRVPVQWLYKTYKAFDCVCEADEDIVARAFILTLIGATIFARPSLDVDLDWLGFMSDIRTIGRYNWGAAALAFLYNQMDDLSRRNTFKCGGLWQAWEIWAREYLNILPLIHATTCERVFPASKKWNLLQKPDADPTIRLQYYTIKIENILLDNLNCNPWGNECQFPWYVAVSIDATKKRILLIRPHGSAWYLAERVLIQSFGIRGCYVAREPPYCMLQPRRLSIRRTRVAVIGQCAHTFINNEHNYGEGLDLRHAIAAESNPISQVGHSYTDEREVGAVLYARKYVVSNNSTSTQLQRSGSHSPEYKDLELQTLNFPTHVKQVPVATAAKLLDVIGGMQILLMDGLQNANQKLQETAFTITRIRDELGLQNKQGTETAGNNTNQASKAYM